jgi:hypothetical protein
MNYNIGVHAKYAGYWRMYTVSNFTVHTNTIAVASRWLFNSCTGSRFLLASYSFNSNHMDWSTGNGHTGRQHLLLPLIQHYRPLLECHAGSWIPTYSDCAIPSEDVQHPTFVASTLSAGVAWLALTNAFFSGCQMMSL